MTAILGDGSLLEVLIGMGCNIDRTEVGGKFGA